MLEEYMLDIGYSEDQINIIKNVYPTFRYSSSTTLYNIKSLYNFFRRNGLSNEEFIYVTTTSPSIISESIENIKLKIIELNTFGFNKIDSFNIIKNYPYILEISNQRIKNKFDKLQELGFLKDNIIYIISENSSLFGIESSSLKKRFQLFIDFGYTEKEIIDIISCVPKLFDCSTSIIQKKFDEFKNMGFKPNEIIKITYILPELFIGSVNVINDKFNDLVEFGYSELDITNIIKKIPIILKDYYLDNITVKLNCLTELGFNNDEIILITCNNPYILLYPEEAIIERFNNLLFFDFSIESIRKMIINLPILFGYNINTVKERISYYDEIGLKNLITINSSILLFPCELIKRRYDFLSKTISIDDNNYKYLFLNDIEFYKKFKISKTDLMKDVK